MANLRDLRKRIRTIESTRKIMMAMKMISASRLSSMRSAHDNARHYHQSLQDAFSALYALLPSVALDDPLVRWYTKPHTPPSQPVKLFVIIGSDKGLCGGYNLNLMKRLRSEISAESHAGYRIHLLPLGQRVRLLCTSLYPKLCLTDSFPYSDSLFPVPSSGRLSLGHWRVQQRGIDYATASDLATFLYKISFVQRQIHECVVLSNRFFSVLKQEPVLTPLFPYAVPDFSKDSAFIAADGDPLLAFKSLILPHLTHRLYALWIEGNTSEYAARMTAMDNASRNAKDIQDTLTLALNRTRQAKVTTELSEIVAGAEAV